MTPSNTFILMIAGMYSVSLELLHSHRHDPLSILPMLIIFKKELPVNDLITIVPNYYALPNLLLGKVFHHFSLVLNLSHTHPRRQLPTWAGYDLGTIQYLHRPSPQIQFNNCTGADAPVCTLSSIPGLYKNLTSHVPETSISMQDYNIHPAFGQMFQPLAFGAAQLPLLSFHQFLSLPISLVV